MESKIEGKQGPRPACQTVRAMAIRNDATAMPSMRLTRSANPSATATDRTALPERRITAKRLLDGEAECAMACFAWIAGDEPFAVSFRPHILAHYRQPDGSCRLRTGV